VAPLTLTVGLIDQSKFGSINFGVRKTTRERQLRCLIKPKAGRVGQMPLQLGSVDMPELVAGAVHVVGTNAGLILEFGLLIPFRGVRALKAVGAHIRHLLRESS
jgi:hypothetical protein